MIDYLKKIDWFLFAPVLLLTAVGVLMIYSTSAVGSEKESLFIRQIFYAGLGIAIFLLAGRIDLKFFKQFSLILYVVSVVLLIITLFIGLETKGAVRWIDLGFITIQSSEIVKPVLVLTLANFFQNYPAKYFRNVILSFLIFAVPTLLVFRQPDLGNTIVLTFIWGSMVLASGINFKVLLGLVGAGILLLPLGWNFLADYQKNRLLSFLNPEVDPRGTSYNLVQSIIAVGSGQFAGKGFGRGTQSQLNFLPEQSTDFIFATTAEELGFIGVFIMVTLFVILILRILSISEKSKDSYYTLVGLGVASFIIVQIFINMGMNMGLVPITGITLPLISFGGSSLITVMLSLGFIQSIKRASKQL